MATEADYDSTRDTLAHIYRVQTLLLDVIARLQTRLIEHDDTKLDSPEKESFDLATPQLKNLVYGSPEYQESLEQLKAALDHHYAVHRHHPEHFAEGIAGMTLIDLIEMLADWKAASERQRDGNLRDGLAVNIERFEISQQLADILSNTITELGW
jgi:hypothetical protein